MAGYKLSGKASADVDDIFEYINDWKEGRKHLPYEIDGVVIKVNDLKS